MVLVYGQDSSGEKSKMFYEGALQDGISAAVAQQKTVFCFVTNDNEESNKWETEFLQDESISELIEKQAVALRLTAGSDEAGYLAQIFPLPKTPTVVIMKNGELKDYIISGVSKEDFMRRVQKAFSVGGSQAPAAAPSTAAATGSAQSSEPAADSTPVGPPAAAFSDNTRRILAERAARLAVEKAEADRKAQEKRALAKEKAKADEEAGVESEQAKARRLADQLYKKKRQQAEEDRQRVLKRIEDDRTERRLRAEERQKERLANQSLGDVASSLVKSPESKLPTNTKPSGMTYLQFRLLDGSMIRSRFATTAPLKDVRKWVDENRTDGNGPYVFKHVLTPMPNRTIDTTEEDKALGDLELAPSSTLIIVPVEVYSSAYANGSSNIFTEILAKFLGFFTWLFGLFGLAGSGGPARQSDDASAEQSETAETTATPQDKSRIRGFRNPDDKRRDQQLYNGNSLNFEPRPDEEDDKE